MTTPTVTAARNPRKILTTGWKILLASGFIIASLFPLVWMAISGLKEKTEVTRTPFQFFPEVFRWENYATVLEDGTLIRTIGVTFLTAILFAGGGLVINSMAAYVFARINFTFKRTVWTIVIGTMFIPAMTILLTSFLVVNDLKMLNTMAVLVLPGMVSAAQIFFLRQFYLGVPVALEEAALLDGAGRFRAFLHIFLPMSKGVFVVSGMTMFLAVWNSYVWPILTISTPELTMVQQFLGTFRGERSTELGLMMAASTLASIPVIILFLIFQRQIIEGARLSGIK